MKRPSKQTNKNSLANLRPIKKGEVRNPNGARTHNPITKALQKLTIETYREVIELVLTGNVDALRDMVKDPKTPAIQVGIATSFMNAIKRGDYGIIERIAERIIGKIPEQLNVNNNTNMNLNVLDEERLKKAYAKIKSDV
jgi:hypothetical protein